jgi:hypothetical protein
MTKEEAHTLYESYKQQVEELGWKMLDTIAQDPKAGREMREDFDNLSHVIYKDKRLHPFQANRIYDIHNKFINSSWSHVLKYDYYDLRDEVEARRDYLKDRGIDAETYKTVIR